MTNTYLLTTQTIIKSMKSMVGILNKAEQWTHEQNISEETILHSKLAPDMFPLIKQVQIVSDNAKGMASRLAGVEAPIFEDKESSFEQLIERLNKTIAFVESIPVSSFDTAEDKKITLPYFPGKYFTAEDYVRDYAVPNFYFHLVSAYAILRNQGMPLGKIDYINDLNLLDL